MADPTPKPKPSKGGLGKKVGPLPAWGWGLIVLVVLGYFLFFRRSNSGTVAGVVSTGAPSGGSTSPLDANAGAINAAQAGQPSTATAPADGLDPSTQGYLLATPSDLSAALTSALGNAYANGLGPYATSTGAGFDTGAAGASVSQATATAPVAAAKPSQSGGTAPKALQPFGGIISKRKLKNGATLTTYANGRQVEQAPGKSAYVVRAGR